ncbi:MAG: potassium channel family protein [Bacteroidales bacterium]
MSFNRLLKWILQVLVVFFIGVFGYKIIEGYSWIDSIYMTVITIGTVGFREVQPLSDVGKIFTSILVIISLISIGLLVTSLTKYLLEGYFRIYLTEKKSIKMISKLQNHVIVCGYGRNGKEAVQELLNNHEKVVVIEKFPPKNEDLKLDGLFFIEGNATEEETLIKANIKNARAIITAMPNDADNLYVILSARELNKNILIVSRASDEHAIKKMKHAGAKNVIMPDKIGGIRMAKLVFQPNVVDFVEQILQLKGNVKIEEIVCTNEYYYQKSIRELDVRNAIGTNILGMRRKDGTYLVNPNADTLINEGDAIFVLGTHDQIITLKKLLQK